MKNSRVKGKVHKKNDVNITETMELFLSNSHLPAVKSPVPFGRQETKAVTAWFISAAIRCLVSSLSS